MAKTYDLLVRARGDTKDADRAMKQLQRNVKSFGSNMQNTGKFLTAAVTLPVVAMAAVGIRELNDMQKANAQTNAVLKSTGGVAGVTRRQVEQLSTSLSRMSGIDDQLIQGGQNILLTFTKIGSKGGVFDRATKASLDLSVAFGKDMNSSAVLVGKALQDPIKGVSALSRVGVSFSAKQKEVIKRLVETGRTAEAQKLILKELETQVGGSAAAYGTTAAGAVGRLKEQFSGLAAQMVTNLLPAFNQVAGYLQRGMSWFEGLDASTKKFAGTMLLVGAALGPVLWGLGSVVSAGSALLPILLAITAPVAAVVLGVTALGAALVVAYAKSETFRNGVNRAFTSVKNTVGGVLRELVTTLQVWGREAAQLWRKHGDDVMAILKPAWRIIETTVEDALDKAATAARVGLKLMRGDVDGAMEEISDAIERHTERWDGFVKKAVWAMGKALATASARMVAAVYQSFDDVGEAIVDGIVNGIQNASGRVADAAGRLADRAKTAMMSRLRIKSPSGVFRDEVGRPIAEGVAEGILRGQRAVEAASAALVMSARKGATKAMGGFGGTGFNVLSGDLSNALKLTNKQALTGALKYAGASSGSPYSVSTAADGTQSVQTDANTKAFLEQRVKAAKQRIGILNSARNRRLKQLPGARKKLAQANAALGRAKKTADKSKVSAAQSAVSAARDAVGTLEGLVAGYEQEILQLGGQVTQDQAALVEPNVDEANESLAAQVADKAAQDARDVENFRRRALGLMSVEEEIELARANEIRAQNGLPPVSSMSQIGSNPTSAPTPVSVAPSTVAGNTGAGFNPLMPTSVSATNAVADSAMRALTGTTFNIQSNDAEAIARRVAFILGGSRLRIGGGI